MSNDGPIGLVLLAAGSSSRLGRPKQLVEVDGQPLLRRAAAAALASPCRPVVVVLGCESEACEKSLQGLAAKLQIVHNPDWAEGMAASIRAGIAVLEETGVTAAVLSVCDQPGLTPAIFSALGEKYRQGASIAAAQYGGHPGVPALFARQFFPQLRALTGDEGARRLLRQQAQAVALVPFPEGGLDVDVPADCPP